MGLQIIESLGASIDISTLPDQRKHKDATSQVEFAISARSKTARSFNTSIRPDIGESEAYKSALLRGEIGILRPMGVNLSGVDFITAIRGAGTSITEVVCTDVKTSTLGKFPRAKTITPASWLAELHDAISDRRFNLKIFTTDIQPSALHPATPATSDFDLLSLKSNIRYAVISNKIRLRQLNVNYSPAGQGKVTGW